MAEKIDPVSQLIGDFGRWQFMLTFLLSLVNFPCTFHIFSPTFQAAKPNDFWCKRPDSLRDLSVDVWKNISGRTKVENGLEKYDACFVKDTTDVNNIWNTSWQLFRKCDQWEYSDSDIGRTIISETLVSRTISDSQARLVKILRDTKKSGYDL